MASLTKETEQELALRAIELRKDVITMLHGAGSGHPAGSLGMADFFAAMYFHILSHRPEEPEWDGRDRLLLSNGHICPVRYAAMARAGYFPEEELSTLRKLGSRLQGHPERVRMPALESTSGPLGAGLAQAAGLAYAARMDGKAWWTYVLTSDGEHDAGLHWEAVLFAGKNGLDNLTAYLDRNHIQIDGKTDDVMPLEPLKEKYEAFNWNAVEIDGNDIGAIVEATERAKSVKGKPTMIILKNTPGKGVDFMENDHAWHGKTPDDAQAAEALRQLDAWERRLSGEKE